MTDPFWSDSDEFTGPPFDETRVPVVEAALGYTLPPSYLALIRRRNGGTPLRTCFPTPSPSPSTPDHVRITGILGIGGEWGIDAPSLGSRAMIEEWRYPDVGVVVAACPSAGHDVVMLDYSVCGPRGEPRVVHVDVECEPAHVIVLADDFRAFLDGLVDASRFERVGSCPSRREMTSCAACEPLRLQRAIRTPGELADAIRVARDNVRDGTMAEVASTPRRKITTCEPDGPWPDFVSGQLRCTSCGALFALDVETYHGGGGFWEQQRTSESAPMPRASRLAMACPVAVFLGWATAPLGLLLVAWAMFVAFVIIVVSLRDGVRVARAAYLTLVLGVLPFAFAGAP